MRYNVCKSSNAPFLLACMKPEAAMGVVNHSLYSNEMELCIAALTSACIA